MCRFFCLLAEKGYKGQNIVGGRRSVQLPCCVLNYIVERERNKRHTEHVCTVLFSGPTTRIVIDDARSTHSPPPTHASSREMSKLVAPSLISYRAIFYLKRPFAFTKHLTALQHPSPEKQKLKRTKRRFGKIYSSLYSYGDLCDLILNDDWKKKTTKYD
jgi:hypothetical protein